MSRDGNYNIYRQEKSHIRIGSRFCAGRHLFLELTMKPGFRKKSKLFFLLFTAFQSKLGNKWKEVQKNKLLLLEIELGGHVRTAAPCASFPLHFSNPSGP